MVKIPNFWRRETAEEKVDERKIIDVYPEEKDALDKFLAKNGIDFSCEKMPDGGFEYFVDAADAEFVAMYLDMLHPGDLQDGDYENAERSSLETKMIYAGAEVKAVEQEEKSGAESAAEDFGVLTIEEQKRLAEAQEKAPLEEKKVKKRATLGRKNEVKVRLTDEEKLLLDARVHASGLAQGEFVRQAILREKIEVHKIVPATERHMAMVMHMGSDLGRIGGMIKKTVAVNNEFGALTPELKAELETEIRELRALRSRIQGAVEEIYGSSKTH